jgi:hypothetical protein
LFLPLIPSHFTLAPSIEVSKERMRIMTHTTSVLTGTVQNSQFLSNFRSLKSILTAARLSTRVHGLRQSGLKSLKPVERLDEVQLERLMNELETGRYRISPGNWMRLRERMYYMQVHEFGNRQLRNERTADENRYDQDNLPVAPDLMWRSKIRGQVIGLEDGRLARRVDHLRAIPYCGVQVPVWLSDVERAQDGISLVRWITGPVQCPRCEGYHLTASVSRSSVPMSQVQETPSAEITCPHCHGTSVRFEREGMVLIAHCLCGWEGMTSLLGLDAEVVAQNLRSVLAAPIRDVEDEEESLMPKANWDGMVDTQVGETEEFEESEAGDLVETLVGMTEGTETSAEYCDPSESAAESEIQDEVDALDAVLTREMVQFWASPAHIGIRRMLLDYTMRGQLTPSWLLERSEGKPECVVVSRERLGLIWMVAATLTQACSRFSPTEEEEFVSWLIESSDEELRQFLPEGADELPLPNVYAKIRSWMRSCRQRVMKFRSQAAGVRLLSRQFGVSETAFQTAITLIAV